MGPRFGRLPGKQVAEVASDGTMSLHFAVMEVEAWLLGMSSFLLKIDDRLTSEFIEGHTGIDILQDPETTYFHPAADLGRIYQSVGKSYDKHLSDISAISSALQKEDYKSLAQSGHCSSFRNFAESLLSFEF